MSTFEKRETAFEAKFTHDAQQDFDIRARRNKLLGQWAAALLGKTGAQAQEYTHDIIKHDLTGAGDAPLLKKLCADLGDQTSEADVHKVMGLFMQQAKAEMS